MGAVMTNRHEPRRRPVPTRRWRRHWPTGPSLRRCGVSSSLLRWRRQRPKAPAADPAYEVLSLSQCAATLAGVIPCP